MDPKYTQPVGNALLGAVMPGLPQIAPYIPQINQFVRQTVQTPAKAGPGWTAANDARNKALKTGTQLPPRASAAPTAAPKPAPAPADSAGAGPSNTETRTNPAGVTQTGRNLGKINLTAADLSAFAGTNVAQFGGPLFPTQPGENKLSDAYAHTRGEGLERVHIDGDTHVMATKNGRIMGLEGDPAAQKGTGVQLPQNATSSYTQITADDAIAASAFGQDWVDANKGKAPAKGSANAMQQALADSGSMRFDPSRYEASEGFSPAAYATPNAEMARRRAFLDSKDSLSGMKAVKAGLGYQTIAGRHYANTSDGIKELSGADERAYRNGSIEEAQSFAQDWMKNNIKKDSTESATDTPASTQNPAVTSGGSAGINFDQAVTMDKITDNPAQVGHKVQFAKPNADAGTALSFGAGLGVIKPSDYNPRSSVWGG